MDVRALLSSKWMRLVIFLWMVVFPVLFIALPVLEMVTGEREISYDPAWAFAFWVLTPAAASVVMKYFANVQPSEKEGEGS